MTPDPTDFDKAIALAIGKGREVRRRFKLALKTANGDPRRATKLILTLMHEDTEFRNLVLRAACETAVQIEIEGLERMLQEPEEG